MTGRCYGIGVGPGDPELVTLRALRAIREVDLVVYLAKKGAVGNARRIVDSHLAPGQAELRLEYPLTTEAVSKEVYEEQLVQFYDDGAAAVAAELDAGRDVGVLCEGDPMFFGSFMYLLNRLAPTYEVKVIPGVASMFGAASVLASPLVCFNETFTVLSGVLPADELTRKLESTDVAVIMKIGRNLGTVRDAVNRAGLLERAMYVERATMENQRVCALKDADETTSPYFSMVVIPSATAHVR